MTPEQIRDATIDTVLKPSVDMIHGAEAQRVDSQQMRLILKLLIHAHEMAVVQLNKRLDRTPRIIA